MKKLLSALLLLACILVSVQSFGQYQQMKAKKKVLFEKAVHYDTLFVFDKALEYYKKFHSKNPTNFYVVNKIADIHRVLGQSAEASEWYAKAITMPEATPIQTWYYAQALRGSGKYELAKKYYEKYAEDNPTDSRPKRISEGLVNLGSYFRDTASFSIINIEINTPFADFSPIWYKNNGIAFVSSRTESKKTDNRWSGGQSFLDLYKADFDTLKKKFGQPELFKGKVISDYHEGPMAFDSSFTKIVFTRNNLIKKTKTSESGIIKLNLFESTITNDVFDKPKRLPFNSPEYSCGHPTLTKDGNLLIFASDMPGGKGGQDLYYSEFSGGTWGEPVNLGADINTEGDEVFPFLHEDGTLYYASDGLAGLGNLDVYAAKKTADKQWGFPKNIGAPINSQYDDFAFIYNKDKNSGFFTSNRPNGKGDDDIYFFDNRQFLLKVYVYDKLTGEPISGSMVRLAENGDTLITQNTDEKGYTIFKTPKGPEYTFKASKDGYKDNYVTFDSGNSATDTVKIPLMRNGFILEALVVDKTTQQPIDAAVVLVKNDKTKDVDSSKVTGLNGKAYPFILANNNYTIKADKFGYFLVSPVNISTFNVQGDTIKVKLELSYLAAGAIVKLENIYYDFDKSNIRKDAAEELDRLVEIMEKYPQMKIEMRSHTDSRGSDAYNMKLSQNRATSAAKYLVKKGIKQTRIAYKGYGETLPVNNCTNDYPCSEAEHQLNRRTEFKVLVQPDGTKVKGTIE